MRRTILSCLLWTLVGITCAAPPEVAHVRTMAAAATSTELPETPVLRTFGVDDGLPSSSVNALAQDARGFLWLATDDGLARYDGVGFRVWRHDPADPASLPGNLIQAIDVDEQGRVWVAMEGHGMAMLLPDGEHFRVYDHAHIAAMGEDDVFAIASTRDGALWFGTFGGGLYRLDTHGTIANWQPRKGDPHSLPDANVLSLTIDAHGDMWVATTSGAARWTGHDFERVDAPGVSDAIVYAITAEADGRLWFATKTGLSTRDPGGRVRVLHWNPDAGEPQVTGLLRDRDGGYWIAAPRTWRRRERVVADDIGPSHSIAVPIAQRVMGMLQDRDGSIWFATQGGGLAQLVPHALQFASFRHVAANPASLSASQPEAMARAGDGRLWVAGGHSLIDRLDPATGAIEHWAPPELDHKYLWALSQNGDGPLWIGYRTGIARADPRTHAIRTWEQDSAHDAPLSGPNDLIAQTHDGRVWVSSLGEGIQERDGEGRVLLSIKPNDGHGLGAADTEQLGTDPQGSLWLAGAQGLLAWNEAKQRFAPVPGAPADRVYGFAFADPTMLWLHKLDGLEGYRWDGHALTLLQHVGAKQGLPAVESGSVLADARGDVWLTTPRGLVRFDPPSGRVRVYGLRDGLPSQEFSSHPALLTSAGLAAAGTLDGLVLFEPARIGIDARPPALVLDAIRVRRGDRDVALDPNAAIELGPDDRDLRVIARLLSFADPKLHRYRYWLHGYDGDWVEGGADGERDFSRLDPGRYRLQVEATNADGVWSAPRELAVSVRPPWWKNGIAYAAYVLLALVVLITLARLYRRRLRQRQAFALAEQRSVMAEQNSEAKSRFLATMGHEIRTPMTGVLGMTELLLGGELAPNQREQAESIQRAGRHLLRIVNDALDLACIEAGKLTLDVAPFDPRALLREVDALLRPQVAAKRIAFDSHVVADVPRGLRGDAARVRQILLNLGNNAIKFTERGSVRIVLTREPEHGLLRVTVVDTGPGMNAQQVERLFERFEQGEGARAASPHGSSGLGLAICRELAAAMGGTVAVESTPGVGTRFDVLLPLPEAELPREAAAPSTITHSPVRTLRLLLVEDDQIVAEVLQGLLRMQGHEVVHAQHGLTALSELENACFDAALLDLDLPGVNGLDLARLIRARGMRLPLLAVTARADATAESDACAAGMGGFLRKPVAGETLANALERLVGR